MTIIAFAGPSLPVGDRTSFRGIEWRPPAEAGDLLRLLSARPSAICLIDGYFDHRPAVRHKEILLLLSEGVRVFGAASIGALRAAEMDRFGMVGVGAIYRAYASGRITGDDEVALAHAPAQWHWRPLSIPLVDVRATLCRAVRKRVVDIESARSMMGAAVAIHYAERSWNDLLEATLLPASKRDRARAWLAEGQTSQKTIDARACLNAAIADRRPVQGPFPPMVRTRFLDALAQECGVALGDWQQGPAPAAPETSAFAQDPGTACEMKPTR